MRLDATDQRFIALVAGDEGPFVTGKLEERSALAGAMSPVRLRPLASRLTEYAKLLARVVLATGTRSPAADSDSVMFEREPGALPQRVGFFALFAPDERVFPLDRNGAMARQADLGAALRLLAGLLPLVIAASPESGLAPYYLMVARACLLVSAHTAATHDKVAHVWRAYRIETAFITAYLRGRGLRSDVIVETTPMAPYNRHLLADTVTLTNPYHVDESRVFAPLSRVGSYRLWGPTEAAPLESTYDGVEAPDVPGVVAVYTQGYWLRVRRGSCDEATAAVMVPLEERFSRIVGELARSHPDVRFLVFPHPMERRYFAETGDRGPAWFEGLTNVEMVDDTAGSSTLAFAGVGLGLTTVSTIGFDRLYMGFRTLFFTGGSPQIDCTVPSQFNALFFEDAEAFMEAVATERLAGNEEFMRAHFDAGAYAPWSAAAPGRPRRTGPVSRTVPNPGERGEAVRRA
jgi:hypothetical protein